MKVRFGFGFNPLMHSFIHSFIHGFDPHRFCSVVVSISKVGVNEGESSSCFPTGLRSFDIRKTKGDYILTMKRIVMMMITVTLEPPGSNIHNLESRISPSQTFHPQPNTLQCIVQCTLYNLQCTIHKDNRKSTNRTTPHHITSHHTITNKCMHSIV